MEENIVCWKGDVGGLSSARLLSCLGRLIICVIPSPPTPPPIRTIYTGWHPRGQYQVSSPSGMRLVQSPPSKGKTLPFLSPGASQEMPKTLKGSGNSKLLHVQFSKMARQKFPDSNCAHPGMMNGLRQS
jgi:hypothetical protein